MIIEALILMPDSWLIGLYICFRDDVDVPDPDEDEDEETIIERRRLARKEFEQV